MSATQQRFREESEGLNIDPSHDRLQQPSCQNTPIIPDTIKTSTPVISNSSLISPVALTETTKSGVLFPATHFPISTHTAFRFPKSCIEVPPDQIIHNPPVQANRVTRANVQCLTSATARPQPEHGRGLYTPLVSDRTTRSSAAQAQPRSPRHCKGHASPPNSS